MKTYRNFIVTCLCCGEMWKEDRPEAVTVKEAKDEITSCRSCGDTLLQIIGSETIFISKRKKP